MDSIRGSGRKGGTLVFVSHDLGAVQLLCNKAIWLDGGQVRAAGQPTDVAMAYLNEVAHRRGRQGRGRSPAQALEDRASSLGHRQGADHDVELCDGTGACRADLCHRRCSWKIRLHYQRGGPGRGAGFRYRHSSPERHAQLCGPNTDFGGLRIPSLEGEGQVIYRIPALPLLEGAYAVSAAVVDHAATPKCTIIMIAPIRSACRRAPARAIRHDDAQG